MSSARAADKAKGKKAQKTIRALQAEKELLVDKILIVVDDMREKGFGKEAWKRIDVARGVDVNQEIKKWLAKNSDAEEFLKNPPSTRPDKDLTPSERKRRDRLGAGTPKNMLRHLGVPWSKENEKILDKAIVDAGIFSEFTTKKQQAGALTFPTPALPAFINEEEKKKTGLIVPAMNLDPEQVGAGAYIVILKDPAIQKLMGLSKEKAEEDPEVAPATEEEKTFKSLATVKAPEHAGGGKLTINGHLRKEGAYISLKKNEWARDPYKEILRLYFSLWS